jgi:hypothetical protein
MKTTNQIISLLAITALVAASPLASGAGGRRNKSDPNALDKIASPFNGIVVHVAGSTISVRGEPQYLGKGPKANEKSSTRTLHFVIKPDVRIVYAGKPATLADVKENDPISVKFIAKEGSSLRQVTEVLVGSLPQEAEKKGEAKKGGKKKKK